MGIPIQNIYYLLSYAWDKLEESEMVAVDDLESKEMADLFAEVLCNGLTVLHKRGLDRGYVPHLENTPRIKGKIHFNDSLKRTFFRTPSLICEYDELTYDVLQNQILKATLERLLRVEGLDEGTRTKVGLRLRQLDLISSIRLEKKHFSTVRVHANNRFYDFLLKLCRLIYDNILISEETGRGRFMDFDRDPTKLATLFEAFVFNFMKREQTQYKVRAPHIKWQAKPLSDSPESLLPVMRTDICLERPDKKIIIDAKFYQNTLISRYDNEKIRSGHLYQIHAYVTNCKNEDPSYELEGLLLYPTTNNDVDAGYDVQGNQIWVKTVNLNQDWQGIRERLLGLLG
jgi:5-methylcytosine-specific restriction enzyme subunit McrC